MAVSRFVITLTLLAGVASRAAAFVDYDIDSSLDEFRDDFDSCVLNDGVGCEDMSVPEAVPMGAALSLLQKKAEVRRGPAVHQGAVGEQLPASGDADSPPTDSGAS